MRYRIALVQACAGSGKTTAARAAVAGTAHRWIDVTSHDGAIAALDALAPFGPATVVLDGVDRLSDAGRRSLVGFIRAGPESRWLLIARERAGLPLPAWVAAGEATAFVSHADLALTGPEVAEAIRASGTRGGAALERFFAEFADGWPVAVRFALAALERSSDRARVAATARALLHDYLEAEILAALPAERRDFLLDLAMLGTADEALLREVGRERAHAELAWLRDAPVPSYDRDDGIALHEAFGEFLRSRVPDARATERAVRAAAALRMRGRVAAAFDLLRRYAPHEALAALRADGFALLDAGCSASVEACVRALPQRVRRDDPTVVALRAHLEAQTGALGRANDLYDRAAQLAREACGEVLARVSQHRALHYLNQGDAGALAMIEPVLGVGSDADRAGARGIYAMALARNGSLEAARSAARHAFDAAREIDDDYLLARTLQRVAYVEYQCGNVDAAEACAREAAQRSQRIGAWFHVLSAHSILYGTAVGARDDREAALRHARQMASAAERAGDRRLQLYARSAQYVLEVERGRVEQTAALEAAMPDHLSAFRDELDCAVALAIRRSWNGEFEHAYRRLAAIDDRVVDASERRVWNAALATIAAFRGDERGAGKHLRASRERSSARARETALGEALAECFSALAEVLRGRPEAAMRRLPLAPPTVQTRALSAFVRELAALGTALGAASAQSALERLRANGQEGIALAVAAALASRAPNGGAHRLTEVERRVLARVAAGSTAAAIAREHGRSIHTVRNQIKAATRKLGASGSIEAVARARRQGLLE